MSSIFRDTIKFLLSRINYAWLRVSNPDLYTYHGVKIPLSATPELERIRRRVYLDIYERDEIDAIKSLVLEDDVVVEIGAGCGVVSVVIAKILSNSQNLFCFEASSKLANSINALMKINGTNQNVTMAAVGIASGEIEFFLSDDFLSSSMIKRSKHDYAERIPVLAFEELLNKLRPDFLMMDIEGAEKDLLNGLIPNFLKVIVVELHPHIIGDEVVSKIIHNLISQNFYFLIDLSNERVLAFSRRLITN